MELSLVESGISTTDVVLASKLGSWATGYWLTNKYYVPGFNFPEVSVDHTTEGFDEANLVRIGELALSAA